ncbi:MAG: SDR family oxidoreductase [Pseudomonadota bacterium]
MSFEGKTVWITGASSGIGAELALQVSASGANVILSGRRQNALKDVAGQCSGDTLVLPFEGTDYAALEAVVENAIAWRGGVDILVNNAGVSQRSLAVETEFSVYKNLMEINFFAPLRLTQLVLPHMMARREGHIAVTSSVAGRVGPPLRSGYAASKHACCGYFEALRSEIEKAYSISVSVIIPGFVQTSIAENALTASGAQRGQSDPNIENGMPVEEAVQKILAGLQNQDREIIVANGIEAEALRLRNTDSATLHETLAAFGEQSVATVLNGD